MYLKVMMRLGISMLIIGSIAGSSYAGAWTAAKGSAYQRFSVNSYRAEKFFDRSGDRTDFENNGEFRDTNLGYYLEYGVSDSLTVIGSGSYKWLEYEDDFIINKTDGFSDLELGLKYRLFNVRGGVVSVQGLLKVPEAYDEDDAVPLGNAQYDYEVRLLYGQSLYPVVPGYINLEAGYRIRAEAPVDEFRYLVECGFDFTQSLYGRAKLDGIAGIDNSGDASTAANPAATFDYDLGKLDVTLGWKATPDWGVELGYRPDLYGKNISSGVNWSLSLIYMMR